MREGRWTSEGNTSGTSRSAVTVTRSWFPCVKIRAVTMPCAGVRCTNRSCLLPAASRLMAARSAPGQKPCHPQPVMGKKTVVGSSTHANSNTSRFSAFRSLWGAVWWCERLCQSRESCPVVPSGLGLQGEVEVGLESNAQAAELNDVGKSSVGRLCSTRARDGAAAGTKFGRRGGWSPRPPAPICATGTCTTHSHTHTRGHERLAADPSGTAVGEKRLRLQDERCCDEMHIEAPRTARCLVVPGRLRSVRLLSSILADRRVWAPKRLLWGEGFEIHWA